VYGATYVDGFDLVDKNYRVTQLPADGSWKRVYCHVKTGSGTTGNIYIGTTTGDTSVTTQMCAIKFEKGSVPTDWSPAAADMPGYDETKVYDISGFRNDATLPSSGINIIKDSPRYRSATNVDGVTIHAKQKLFEENLKQFTVSAWIKLNDGWVVNNGFHIICFGGTYARICLSKDSAMVRVLVPNETSASSGTGYSFGEASDLVSNHWYHVACVFNAGTVTCSVDGEVINSTTTNVSSYYVGNSAPYFGSHGSEKCNGAISDWRFYVTALDSDEVRDLYQAGRVVRT
jgi:hypothetical protein